MRSQYGLRETPCNDCLVHWCCEPCALCQEYRELKHRGFDISIGKWSHLTANICPNMWYIRNILHYYLSKSDLDDYDWIQDGKVTWRDKIMEYKCHLWLQEECTVKIPIHYFIMEKPNINLKINSLIVFFIEDHQIVGKYFLLCVLNFIML